MQSLHCAEVTHFVLFVQSLQGRIIGSSAHDELLSSYNLKGYFILICMTCQLLENNSNEPIQYKTLRDYWSKVILEVIQVCV